MKKFLLFLTLLVSAIGLTHAAETQTYSIDFETKAPGDVTNIAIGNCKAVFAKNNGSNEPKYYTNADGNAVRMYLNNTLTISAPENYYITEITVSGVYKNNKYSFRYFGLNDGEKGTLSPANNSASWVCGSNNLTSVSFKTNEKQVWVQKITVKIEAASTDPTDAGLSFANATENATYDTEYTLQTLRKNDGVEVSWTSSDTDVAEFVDGVLKIKKAGKTTITATATDLTTYTKNTSASYTLIIAKGTPIFTYVTKQYDYEMQTGGAGFSAPELTNTNGLAVTYESDKPEVATVDTNGKITPITRGTAVITATGAENDQWNGATASLTVIITKNLPQFGFENDEYTKYVDELSNYNGESLSFVTTEGLTFTYSIVSDDNIATIDPQTGKLTFTGNPGTATITATSAETDVYESGQRSYKLTVTKRTTELTFADATIQVYKGETYEGQVATSNVEESLKEGFTITYASSNEAVATVDANTGAVTLTNAEGTTTITATASGNTYYTDATASYTITVAKQYVFADTKVTLVKDYSTLNPGDVIVIANQDASVAMSTSSSNNTKRGQTSVTLSDDKFEITYLPADALLLELGQVKVTETDTETGTQITKLYWTLNALNFSKEGVLYCGTSSNDLKLGTPQSDNVAKSYATIAINSTTGEATIMLNKGITASKGNRNIIRYNYNEDPRYGQLFSCYYEGQQPVYIYKVETPTTIFTADNIAQTFVETVTNKNNEVKLTYNILTESTVSKFAIQINGVTTDIVNNNEGLIEIALTGVPYLPDADITICPVLAEDAKGNPTTLGHPETLNFNWADINSYGAVELDNTLVWIGSDADPLPTTATLGAISYFGIDVKVANLNYYVDVLAKNQSSGVAYNGEFAWCEGGFSYAVNPYIEGVPVDTQNKSLDFSKYTKGFPTIEFSITPIYKFDVAEQYRSLVPAPTTPRPARVASSTITDGVQTVVCDAQQLHSSFSASSEVSGVEGVTVDANAPVEFFNLQGVRVDGALAPGIYIRRQGQAVSKVRIN